MYDKLMYQWTTLGEGRRTAIGLIIIGGIFLLSVLGSYLWENS